MRFTAIFFALAMALHALAQTVDTPHNHSIESGGAAVGNVIDGSVEPDKIRDVDAYRLFLVTVAAPATPTEQEHAQQLALLKPVGLESPDLDATIKALASFKAQYDDLIRKYNDSALIADVHGTEPDIKSFLSKRDSLVESTRSELQAALTPVGMSTLDKYVKDEKKNMKIAVEDEE